MVGTVGSISLRRASPGTWTFGAAGTPEMQTRLGQSSYEIVVAMDIGESRTAAAVRPPLLAGQRVALRGGELEPM